MRNWQTFVLAAAVVASAAGSAQAALDYGTAGSVLSQNFDSLAASGTNNPFVNNVTLPGFYAFNSQATNGATGRVSGSVDNVPVENWGSPTAYAASSSTGGSRLYSYGTAAGERAFGTLAGSSAPSATAFPGDQFIALVIHNTTGGDLDSFTLSYTGEQWVQTNLTTNPQRLKFNYLVKAGFDAAADIPTQAGFGSYTNVPELDFVSVQNGATAGSVIDGNLPENQSAISATVPVTIPAGSYLILRWWDDDDNGNDNGLGIDNLSFSATAASIPEPGVAVLMPLAAGAILARRRR